MDHATGFVLALGLQVAMIVGWCWFNCPSEAEADAAVAARASSSTQNAAKED
jgi:hypothetical protein